MVEVCSAAVVSIDRALVGAAPGSSKYRAPLLRSQPPSLLRDRRPTRDQRVNHHYLLASSRINNKISTSIPHHSPLLLESINKISTSKSSLAACFFSNQSTTTRYQPVNLITCCLLPLESINNYKISTSKPHH